MDFCSCAKRKYDESEIERQKEKFIVCPVCRLVFACAECAEPARFLDVFGEPKCFEHDIVFLP